MFKAVTEAQDYLIKKFGGAENVKPGAYAVPTTTSKGQAYMKVVIDDKMGMSGFHLFKDEQLTQEYD